MKFDDILSVRTELQKLIQVLQQTLNAQRRLWGRLEHLGVAVPALIWEQEILVQNTIVQGRLQEGVSWNRWHLNGIRSCIGVAEDFDAFALPCQS